jgi:hypothetical protein
MAVGELVGMKDFDGELVKLVRMQVFTMGTALLYATMPVNLQVQLADVASDEEDSLIVR